MSVTLALERQTIVVQETVENGDDVMAALSLEHCNSAAAMQMKSI